MKQCERGHFYDNDRYAACPYCQNVQQGIGATVGLSPMQEIGKTMPVAGPGAASGAAGGAGDVGKTVAVIKKNIGIDPPVAFIVVIDGIHKGEAFRLHAGRNFIGRGNEADISLPSDDTVSREAHALISYDIKSNSFMIAPGQGRGITYVNEKEVATAEPITAYDIIEVGKSKLMFLPVCGQNFQWDV